MNNVNNIKNLTEGIKKIADILWDIDPQHTYSEESISQIEKFVKRINRHYPFDSIDALDMVNVVLNHYYVPRPETIDILEEIFKKAEFVRGELHWKYRHPFLTASFYPMDTSGRYDIIFTSISKDGTVPISAVSFPLKVTFHEWANMDEKEYHDEASCSLYYPEHEDDCALTELFVEKEDPTPEEINDALEQCECATECCCESYIIRTETITFDDRDFFFRRFESWLYGVHYNTIPETHSLTYPNTRMGNTETFFGGVMTCSCGEKWILEGMNLEDDLTQLWLRHVEEMKK